MPSGRHTKPYARPIDLFCRILEVINLAFELCCFGDEPNLCITGGLLPEKQLNSRRD